MFNHYILYDLEKILRDTETRPKHRARTPIYKYSKGLTKQGESKNQSYKMTR